MSNPLTIGSDGLALPLAAVTTSQAILAMKRKGKSYTASVEAEEMLEAQQVVGVLDPTGAWWGLRSSPDGKGAGYAVVVFGGDHPDAPLDYTAGRAMAQAWVEHNFSAIWDLSLMDTDEQCTFVMDFCRELLRINRIARHLFIDEADTFAPQTPIGKIQPLCRQVVARLVKQGGKNGSGVTLITQRPQAIDKNALSQIDLLVLLRISSPADAVEPIKWIRANVGDEWADRVRAEVPRLAIGEAFVFWPDSQIEERTQIRERRTFNSGRTVVPGEVVVEPTVMAKVDAAALGQQIATSIEKAKEESPEYLQAEIKRLKAELETNAVGGDVGKLEEFLAEQVDMQRQLQEAQAAIEPLQASVAAWHEWRDRLLEIVKSAPVAMAEADDEVPRLRDITSPHRAARGYIDLGPETLPTQEMRPSPDGTIFSTQTKSNVVGINAPQQKILNAMATLYRTLPFNAVTIELIAVNAETTARARGFEENMKHLRRIGMVAGIKLTEAGSEAARPTTVPARWSAVLGRLKNLSGPQEQMLCLMKRGVSSLEALASEMNTTVRARGFEENVKALKRYGYAAQDRGELRLVQWLRTLPA